MYPAYQSNIENFEIHHRRSIHVAPHIHESVECVYLTDGTLELGIGTELYHMEQGDFAVIFPGLIHHYQVFSQGESRMLYLLASPPLAGSFLQTLQTMCPEQPVIPAAQVHPDIVFAMNTIYRSSRAGKEHPIPYKDVMRQAYLQIILAHAIPCYHLIDKNTFGSDDLIFRMVCYLAEHYTEEVSLTEMARELHASPYALSRIFSSTFHTNFNQYVNDLRLDYARYLLENTDQTITEAYENAGFASQRTFNRVFREEFHVSPREYRKAYLEAQGPREE